MSEFIGARISLISRSDIRYIGTLHEINSDESTVSLENVRSFGTEGRKAQEGKPAEEVAPSDELYEYIIFRGTDVKDLRIEETPAAVKENKPPAMPNDPAIVGARARPGPPTAGPSGPAGFQQGPPNPGPVGPHAHNPPAPPPYFPPPQMGGWGRAQGPGPEGFGNMQYPPPPQWFPPGQQFPPMGPGPWNNYPFQPGHGAPPGPPGAPGMPGAPGQPGRQSANHTPNNAGQQQPKPAPIGPAADKKPTTPAQQQQQQQQKQGEPSTQPKPVAPQAKQQAPAAAPAPPVESKPTVEEVKATAAALSNNAPPTGPREAANNIPTGPKSTRPTQILPAVPLPAALTQKVSPRPQASSSKPAEQAGGLAPSLRDATQAAKNAVAVAMAQAMAKMEGHAAPAPAAQPTNGNSVDNLTRKVNEMRVNAPRGGQSNRGSRGGRPPRAANKVEVPDSDFDFETANAKFNKQELVKEALTGSPLAETLNNEAATPEAAAEADPAIPPAYNKSKSFFDNISSEAKDRVENNGQKPGGREWRGEEHRKNVETFGQGSVDGGYRGYRGRGRGRGGRGRGYRGSGRGGMGGVPRPRENQPATQ